MLYHLVTWEGGGELPLEGELQLLEMAVEKGQLVHIYSGKIKQLEKTVVLVLMLEFVVEVFNIDNRHGRCELALWSSKFEH